MSVQRCILCLRDDVTEHLVAIVNYHLRDPRQAVQMSLQRQRDRRGREAGPGSQMLGDDLINRG